jgi:hypothetical protein
MAARAVHPQVVVLASTFYTPALQKPFVEALTEASDTRQLICVPYNQLQSFLLNPGAMIPPDCQVQTALLLRIEDVIRPELVKGGALAPERVIAVFQERARHLESLLARTQLRLSVLICPSGRGCYDLGFLGNRVRVAEHRIAAALRLRQRHLVVEWFEWPDLESGVREGSWFNTAGDRLGHVPFTPRALQAIASYFVSRIDELPSTSITAHAGSGDALALEKFLGSLELEFTAVPMLVDHEQILLDLVRHTTHFINLADRKWERPVLQGLAAGGEAWTMRVRDRFGDYGISGAVTFRMEPGLMKVGLLFLSCPVLGKQLEHALFAWLGQIAASRGSQYIEIPFTRGPDNEGLYSLLSGLSENPGWELPLRGETTFRLAVSDLAERVRTKAVNPAAVADILSAMRVGNAA